MVIRFERQFDYAPYIIFGVIATIAIISLIVAYKLVLSWIFARRDKVQNNLKKLSLKAERRNKKLILLYFFFYCILL